MYSEIVPFINTCAIKMFRLNFLLGENKLETQMKKRKKIITNEINERFFFLVLIQMPERKFKDNKKKIHHKLNRALFVDNTNCD